MGGGETMTRQGGPLGGDCTKIGRMGELRWELGVMGYDSGT